MDMSLKFPSFRMLLVLGVLIACVYSKTLNENIYTSIDFGRNYCFRLNNFNSQIGCQTSRDGDSGILFQFKSSEDIENSLEDLKEPFIAVLDASIFNNITASRLKNHQKTRGLLLIEDDEKKESSFSPEKTCPGNGFNYNENITDISSTHQCISEKLWNPKANWLSYDDFPFGIFLITSQAQKEIILSKTQANRENNSLKPYPLWGGEVRSFMKSAQNTETCLRRGTCDPLGGYNVHVNLIPRDQKGKKPVILLITKTDSTAFFKELSFGEQDSGVSTAVLLSVIKALSTVRDGGNSDALDSDVMITFLQGESFDYSGSQRLAYKLDPSTDDTLQLRSFNLTIDDVVCVIELGPISILKDLYLYPSHSDDVILRNVSDWFVSYNSPSIKFHTVAEGTTIPPSSIHSFLRENKATPCILLTDGHDTIQSNYFGSRYDTLDNSDALATRVKDLSEIIAKVTVKLSNGTEQQLPYAKVEKSLVSEVIDCFLVNLNCTLLRRIGNQFNSTAELPNSTLSRYSGVRNSFAVYVRNISLDFSMKHLSDIPVDRCNSTYTQNWAPIVVNDTCYGYVVNSSSATSPAFKLKDYSSTKYSTWTESRWSPNFRVRLFLMDSTSDNVTLLCCGLLYFVVLSGLIFQCHRRSDQIFPQ